MWMWIDMLKPEISMAHPDPPPLESPLVLYGRDENRTGYHSPLIQLHRGIFSQSTWQHKC